MASDAELRSSLSVLSGATQISGAHAVSFQPSDTLENEDRYIVEDWTLQNECWTFLGVFDGVIRDKLTDRLVGKKAISDSDIAELLVESIREIDERITNDFKTFFPSGPPEISGLSDDEIVKRISNSDTGASHAQVMRARTGTTALVAVIDQIESVIKLANPPYIPTKHSSLISSQQSASLFSNTAEVVHFHLADLAPNTRTILILCSDGLRDLYKKT
ncbi:hypothetical protein BDP27DRAFT_1342265, partial [Rhodocollybia butyracea]